VNQDESPSGDRELLLLRQIYSQFRFPQVTGFPAFFESLSGFWCFELKYWRVINLYVDGRGAAGGENQLVEDLMNFGCSLETKVPLW
jgi:hypothetical protein